VLLNPKFDPPTAGIDPNPALLGRNPKQIQNSNAQMFKTDSFAAILSEAKNLFFVGQILRPPAFLRKQEGGLRMTRKCHFGHLILFRASNLVLRISY